MNRFRIGLYIENRWGDPTSKNYISSDARNEVLEWVLELFATQFPEHKCKYCGAMTTQSDEDCYKAPVRFDSQNKHT